MPYSTGMNQGPFMFGIDTPTLSAALAGWPTSRISPIEATMPATPALPKARYCLCITFLLLRVTSIDTTSAFLAHVRVNERLIQRDGQYQRATDDHHLRVGWNVQQIQAIRENADEQHPERHTDDGAATAEQRDSAKHNCRHRFQWKRRAKRRLSRSYARGENDGPDGSADAAEN